MGPSEGTDPRSRGYLPLAAFGICATCLLVMVPLTFVALSGADVGYGRAVPALAAAMAVAVLALVTSGR